MLFCYSSIVMKHYLRLQATGHVANLPAHKLPSRERSSATPTPSVNSTTRILSTLLHTQPSTPGPRGIRLTDSQRIRKPWAKPWAGTQPSYSWIADQRGTHEKLIYQRTRRATTFLRPPLKNSRQGEFRSEWCIFGKKLF